MMQTVLLPHHLRAWPHPALVPLQGGELPGHSAGDRTGCSVAAQGSPSSSSGALGRSHAQEPVDLRSLCSRPAGDLYKALMPDTIRTARC